MADTIREHDEEAEIANCKRNAYDVQIDEVIDEIGRLAPDPDDINRPIYLARIQTLERLRDLPK
jgi:hypothetical protein